MDESSGYHIKKIQWTACPSLGNAARLLQLLRTGKHRLKSEEAELQDGQKYRETTGGRNPGPNKSVDIDDEVETQYYVIHEPTVGTSFGALNCTADLHLQDADSLPLQADDDLH